MKKAPSEGILRSLIARIIGRDVGALSPGDSLRRVLGLDGLDVVRVLVAAEEHLGVVIREELIDRIETYGDLLVAIGIGEADGEPCQPAGPTSGKA